MDKIISQIRSNPVLVVALVSAVLTLAASFGLHLSKEQTGAIIAVVNTALAFVARSKVSPVSDAEPIED